MTKAQRKRPMGSPPNSLTRSVNRNSRHEVVPQEGIQQVQLKSIRLEFLTSWEAFVKALQIRFGTSSYDDPLEALISIKQTSIVELYKTQFEMLSNRVRGLSDSHRLSCFLGGLKKEIKMGVRMLNAQNLVVAYELARMQEETLTITRKSWRPSAMGFQSQNPTPTQPRG